MAVPLKPTNLLVQEGAEWLALTWVDPNAGAYPPRLYWKLSSASTWLTADLSPGDLYYRLEGLSVAEYDVGVTYFDPASPPDESNMVSDVGTPVSADSLLIEDHFYEPTTTLLENHTPITGGSWTQAGVVWGHAAATLQCQRQEKAPPGSKNYYYVPHLTTSNTEVYYYHSEDLLDAAVDIYVNMLINDRSGSTFSHFCGVVFRAGNVGVKSGYELRYQHRSSLTPYGIGVIRWDSGTPTVLFDGALAPADGTLEKYKLNVTDDVLTLYHWEDPGGGFDWVQKWQGTDSTHTSGRILVATGGLSGKNINDYIRIHAVPQPPGKPTITIADQAPDSIDYTSSAFAQGVPNSPHYASQWQVTLVADTGFATPVIDVTATNASNFEAFHAGGLNLFLNQYIGRVRHQDYLGRWSAWSDASAASSLETSGQYYTAFAERPLGIDIREDLLADWSELDISDGESTWFLEYRPDATCQVTMDRVIIPDTGDVNTVDPILWEGFPSVAQQIVFGRFIFDTVQANQEPCTSGVADPSGLICREEYGLVDLWYGDDGLTGWRVARGEISPDADDPGLEGWALKTTDGDGAFGGNDVLQYAVPVTDTCINEIFPLIVWDGAGDLSDDYWYQIAWRWQSANPDAFYYWIGEVRLAVGIQSGDDEYFTACMGHLCNLYQTYGWAWIRYKPTVGYGSSCGAQPARISTPFGKEWQHNKLQAKTGEQHRKFAWLSHTGHDSAENRDATADVFSTPRSGKVGLEYWHSCPYDADGCVLPKHQVQYDEAIVCTENHVTVLDLPLGWKFQIGGTGPHVTTNSAFWPQAIYGDATDNQIIDFGAFAFPADTIYLTYPGSDEPDIVWDVPTGIWGGDVYRIKPSVVGAAGVAARLTGTFEGTDGSGYLAYVEATGGLILDKWTAAGGLVNLDAVAFDVLPGVYYNVVLEAVGSTIRAKAWAGGAGLQGDPENNDPGTWMISVTDTDYASGAPGLVALTEQPVDFDVFAVGLGGDPYPTGRYPGLCTWLNPVEGIIVTESPLVLEWTPPPITADVIGMELGYDLEFQQNGQASWTPLASDLRATTYSWNLTGLPAGHYCVRVRVGGCEVGPWAQVCFQWQTGLRLYRVPDGYFFGDWYTGEPDTGQWIRLFQASHQDDTSPVPGCLITRELMPAGVNGECLFQKLYVTVTTTTTGILTVTPILDGDYLLEEQRVVALAAEPGELRSTQRYEVDLTRGFGDPERWRYGYRGSYFQVEICATDYSGQGRIEIDGVAVRLTVVRETHPWARPFVGELEVDVDRENNGFFFFGTTTDDDTIGAIYAAEEGTTDFGDRLRFLVEPNKHAPLGPSEEAWFRTLYLSFTRSNVNDIVLEVVPILDDTELATTTVTLPGVIQPITDIHEVPLSIAYMSGETEIGRYGARGVWFSFRITNTSQRSAGELAFNGAAVEVIPARETEPGVT
jgi:hypothetical protein